MRWWTKPRSSFTLNTRLSARPAAANAPETEFRPSTRAISSAIPSPLSELLTIACSTDLTAWVVVGSAPWRVM